MDIDLGFGLWGRCEPETDAKVLPVIERLARRFGGHAFRPHVTLASGFQSLESALAAAEESAATLAGVTLRFHRAEGTPRFYRALYLRAEEDAALTRCHADLARRSGQPEGAFIPHLSLFYGSLGETERAMALTEALLLVPLVARLTRIEVWRLSGPAEAWQLVGGVALPQAAG